MYPETPDALGRPRTVPGINIRLMPDFTSVLSNRRTCADDKELGRTENGAPRRNRTADPIITNDVLYQLSYRGTARVLGERPRGRKRRVPAARLGLPRENMRPSAEIAR